MSSLNPCSSPMNLYSPPYVPRHLHLSTPAAPPSGQPLSTGTSTSTSTRTQQAALPALESTTSTRLSVTSRHRGTPDTKETDDFEELNTLINQVVFRASSTTPKTTPKEKMGVHSRMTLMSQNVAECDKLTDSIVKAVLFKNSTASKENSQSTRRSRRPANRRSCRAGKRVQAKRQLAAEQLREQSINCQNIPSTSNSQ